MDKYAEMVDRLLLGSSGDKPYGFKSHYLYLAVEDPVEDGIASSMVEYYTSDIAILVRFQCNALDLHTPFRFGNTTSIVQRLV